MSRPGQNGRLPPMAKVMRIPISRFAPAERVPIAIIHRQAAALERAPLTAELLDAVLNRVFILNPQRQIVFASRGVLDLAPGKKRRDLLGLRPGEALGCVHVGEGEGGCGTAEICRSCGAVNAILKSLAGRRELREYRLTRFIGCREETLDLLVMATPLAHPEGTFSLLAIADARSRSAMEQLFARPSPKPIRISTSRKAGRTRAPTQAARRRGR